MISIVYSIDGEDVEIRYPTVDPHQLYDQYLHAIQEIQHAFFAAAVEIATALTPELVGSS